MKRSLLVSVSILLLSCHHVRTQETSKEVNADVSSQRHETSNSKQQTSTSTNKIETTGPVETNEVDVAELYGWAPPAPDAPKGTPYTWKPIRRGFHVSNTKAAGTTATTKTDTSAKSQSTGVVDTSDKSKVGVKEKGKSVDSLEVGLSWPVKLAIAIAALLALIGAVAWFKPKWLTIPIGWIAGFFKKKQAP